MPKVLPNILRRRKERPTGVDERSLQFVNPVYLQYASDPVYAQCVDPVYVQCVDPIFMQSVSPVYLQRVNQSIENIFSCQNCCKTFSDNLDLINHSCGKDSNEPCTIKTTFSLKASFDSYCVDSNEENLVKCNDCHKTFLNDICLKEHDCINLNEESICEMNQNVVFDNNSSDHLHTEFSEKKAFVCNICQNVFTSGVEKIEHTCIAKGKEKTIENGSNLELFINVQKKNESEVCNLKECNLGINVEPELFTNQVDKIENIFIEKTIQNESNLKLCSNVKKKNKQLQTCNSHECSLGTNLEPVLKSESTITVCNEKDSTLTNKSFLCRICKKSLSCKSCFQIHYEMCQKVNAKKFQQKSTENEICKKKVLEAECDNPSNENTLVCQICYKTISNKVDFIKHVLGHDSNKKYANQTAGSEKACLDLHCVENKRHLVMSNTCHKTFLNDMSLKEHACTKLIENESICGEVSEFSKERPFVCNTCQNVFTNKISLMEHTCEEVIEEKVVENKIKLKMCVNKKNDEQYQISESQKCNLGKAVEERSSPETPNEILLKHDSEKNAICMPCDSNGIIITNFYPCHICYALFTTEPELKAHLSHHAKNKKFGFTLDQNRTSPNRLFFCRACQNTFPSEFCFDKHSEICQKTNSKF